jgi:hypothetical protein
VTGTDYLGSAGAGQLAAALRRMPQDIRQEQRPALRAAGALVRNRAASNASWSTRIPGALRVTTSGAVGRSAVSVTVSRARAPHARPLEGITGGRSFRHPVFGTDRWVTQACRPFLAPAANTSVAAVEGLLVDALDRALSK